MSATAAAATTAATVSVGALIKQERLEEAGDSGPDHQRDHEDHHPPEAGDMSKQQPDSQCGTAKKDDAAATRRGSPSNPATTQRVSPHQPARSSDSLQIPSSSSSNSSNSPLEATRNVYRVKRFLYTLVQFGSDISQATGDRVRELVFNLVAGILSVSEFHSLLQEVTHLPLRPFVLPFLKANLPLLARDVAGLALLSGQSSLQYVRTHQHVIMDMSNSFQSAEPADIFHSELASTTNNSSNSLKRRTSSGESVDTDPEEATSGAKRTKVSSSGLQNAAAPPSSAPPPSSAVAAAANRARQQQRVYPQPWTKQRQPSRPEHHQQPCDEEWKNINVMVNCIGGMVDKTKRALAIWHQRQQEKQYQQLGGHHAGVPTEQQHLVGEAFAVGLGNSGIQLSSSPAATAARSGSRQPNMNELLAATIRSTEEKVVEVRRRAEEAVQEVKRVAMTELQRAVALAERRAIDSVAGERLRMELLLDAAVRSTKSKDQTDSEEQLPQHQCWNCGRGASETCSGCGKARYCSQFCQHKDWEGHHKVCITPSSSSKNDMSKSVREESDGSSAVATTPVVVVDEGKHIRLHREDDDDDDISVDK